MLFFCLRTVAFVQPDSLKSIDIVVLSKELLMLFIIAILKQGWEDNSL